MEKTRKPDKAVLNTVNSTIENHRQWRTTRKDIAEFLET